MTMINLEGKHYYTALKFAEEVGVTKAYVCRLLRNKVLPSLSTGHQYLIPIEALDVWETLNHKDKNK